MAQHDNSGARESTIDLPSLWQVVWRYRLFIAAIALLAGAIAAALALVATPVFRAEATVIAVDNQNLGGGSALMSQLGGIASLAGVNLAGSGGTSVRDAKALLESRVLIEEFIRRNKLEQVIAGGGGKPATLWQAVEKFEKNVVSITDDLRKGKTLVTVEWTDPKLAAEWANNFVGLANELVRARAIARSRRNVDFLNQQIAQTNVVELQKVMYNIIESETKTLMLANAQPEYAFAIMDPAVTPEMRFKPKRTLIVLVGLIIGTFGGVFAAFAHSALRQEKRAAQAGP